MRSFLAILVVLLTVSKATSTLEDGDLVELINATSPIDEGITGGEYHPGPPVGPPGTRARARRHLSIETGDLVEKIADASDVDEGAVGDFHPGPPVGVPTTPEGRRLDPEGGLTVVSVTHVDAHVPEEQRRRLCSYSVEIRDGTTCYASGAEVVARISTCGSAGNATAGEWAGVYYDGAPNWPPYNWHYLCGGQGCAAAVAPGTYDIGFTIGTRTQNPVGPWPLPTATYLRVYFHLGVGGSLYSNTFSVGPTCLAAQPNPNPTPTPPPVTPTPAPQPNPTPAPVTCSEGVSTQNCWGLGQTIQLSVNTCGTSVSSNPGWAGIYYAGTTNYAAALNWQYICGSQSCATAVGPANGYSLNMNVNTRGSLGWPLAVGPTYQVFLHTGSGTFASGTFQITSTGSCTATPSSPTTPTTPSSPSTTAPASSPSSPSSSSAPATTSSSSSSPVQTLYVQASAQDCDDVRNGNINVGAAALNTQQFFITFALGVNGQVLTTAQIESIVTQAFQGLIGESLLNCSHRRFMLRKQMTLHHPKAKHGHSHNNKRHHHRHHHHHHRERQLQQVHRFDSFHRRLDEIPENIIGFVEFQTTCAVDAGCHNPFLSECYMCTTTIIVYVKGPVDQADVQAAVQAIIDSPTFFEDLGMIEDIVFLQPEEDLQIITGDPTSGPTSEPTSGPTSEPTSAPTSGPTSGPTTPTSGPTSSPTSIPTDGPTSRPTTGPTSSPTSIPTEGPTSRPTTGPTSIPTSGPTPEEGFEDLPPTSAPTSGPTMGSGSESGPPPPGDSPTDPSPPGDSPTDPSPPGDSPSSPPPPGDSPTGPGTPQDPGSKGDPHFKTWRNEHFEYHGQCDIVLAKDPDFANGLGLDVHIRTKLIRFWSYIQSAVIRIGNDILEIQGMPGKFTSEIHYWVNYEYQGELEEFAGFPVTLVPLRTRIDIDLDSIYPGQMISLSAFKEFVKVSFGEASKEAFGNTVGILGNFTTGKTLSRDGVTVLDDFTELGQEWQVNPSDTHLFRETSHPQFPELCIEPDDPRGDRARRLGESGITGEQAEAACAGIKDEMDRKDCVYDILATQDMDMAGAY